MLEVLTFIPRWNQLDVAIVLLSVLGIVLEEMKSDLMPINPTIMRVMRVLRIARGKIFLSRLNVRSSGNKLDSRLEGRGFKSHQMIDGNGVKAMPRSIPEPNPESFNNWKERKYR